MRNCLLTFISLIVCSNLFSQSVGGTVAGSTTVCASTNSGALTLSGHTGDVVRWQYSTTNGSSWKNISNSKTTQDFSNLNTTTWYRAEVLQAAPSAFSTPAIITVDDPSSATVNSNAEVCYGANHGVLSLNGIFTNVASWDFSTDAGLTWTAISNNSTTQTYSNLTASTQYRATVANGTCPTTYAASATITVSPVSIGGTVSGFTTVCSGTNSGALTLAGQTGDILRWQYSDDDGVSWSNTSNSTAMQTFSNLYKTTQYRAVIQSGNCIAANSSPAIVWVTPASEGGEISSDVTVCSGINNGILQLKNYNGNIEEWQSSADAGKTWINIANTSDKYSYNNLTTTTLFRARVKNETCASAFSEPVKITVSPASVGGNVLGDDTVCNGSNSGLMTISGYAGDIIRWQSSDDKGLNWSNIGNSSGITSCSYSNLTSTTLFRAVVQNEGCPAANSLPATIAVLPASEGGALSPASLSVCKGLNSGTISLSRHSGNIIRWEASNNNGITWVPIADTNIAIGFNNLMNTVQYRVFVQQGTCTGGYSSISTISVSNPSNGGIISGSDTVCTDTNNGSLLLSGYTGAILNWEYSKNGGTTWSNISNTTAAQFYANLNNSTLYRAVVQSEGCMPTNSQAATITVNPVSVGGMVLGSTTLCDSLTGGKLTLKGYVGNILYWEYSSDSGSTWISIANKNDQQSYSGITNARRYEAIVQNTGCVPASSSYAVVSHAIPIQASYSFTTNSATVLFTNTSKSNGGKSFWDFGDNTSSTITNPAHTYIANGTYSVRLIVADSCSSDTSKQTIVISGVGINDLTYNNQFVKIYPNPFSNIATVQIQMNHAAASVFKIYNLLGKKVKTREVESGENSFTLNQDKLSPGIYFYKLQSKDKIIATGKFMIQ